MEKRVYSKEFKVRAVQLSYQRENIKELADELGKSVERLYKWRKADKVPKSSQVVAKDDSLEVKE